jgi:hypothetical protein
MVRVTIEKDEDGDIASREDEDINEFIYLFP